MIGRFGSAYPKEPRARYLPEKVRAARGNPERMAPPRPTRKASPVTRRRHPEPEVIRLAQGQARRITAELLDAETEEDSTVRPAWPGRSNIEQIFREAQRLKA